MPDQERERLVPCADPRWERERNHAANDFLQQYAADIVTVRLSPLDAFKIGYEIGFLRAAALAPELTDARQERDAAAFAAWWARFAEAYPLAKAEPKIQAAALLAWHAALASVQPERRCVICFHAESAHQGRTCLLCRGTLRRLLGVTTDDYLEHAYETARARAEKEES